MVGRRRRHDPERPRRPLDVEPRPAGHVGDRRPAALGDQPGRGDVPGRHARPTGRTRRTARSRRTRARAPPSPCCATRGSPCGSPAPGSRPPARRARARRRSRSAASLSRRVDRRGRRAAAGPSAVAAERLAAHRVVDDADRRTGRRRRSADRHAEERDPVGVVDRAVERVDDPGPAAGERAGRAGRRRRPAWCAPDSSARIPSPGKRSRIASMISASDRWSTSVTTSRARLVVDLLDPLVALEQDPPRPARRAPARTRRPSRTRLATPPVVTGRSRRRAPRHRPEAGHDRVERHRRARLDERALDERRLGPDPAAASGRRSGRSSRRRSTRRW